MMKLNVTGVALALLVTHVHGAVAFGPGKPLEKGMIYVQPSYHYSNNLKLDLAVLRTYTAHVLL